MKELMEKFGYQEGYHENEWIKRNWTVRFYKDEVEAFDNPIWNTPARYLHKKQSDINIETLLQEIENYII